MFDSLDISSSGLQAQRVRLDTIANNIANINTTHDAKGNTAPFRRQFAVFSSGSAADPNKPGVHIQEIATDKSDLREVFEPSSPDADTSGIVRYPNIEMTTEYVNALECTRAYEANITAMEATKSMLNASLRLLA